MAAENTAAVAQTPPLPLVTEADLVNPLIKVSDAMTSSPRTCSPASTALEAALVMHDADCGVMPVVDVGRPVGVVTDRDIALALPSHDTSLGRAPVSELMKNDVVTITPDASLTEAVAALGHHGVRRLLVIDAQEQLVGILSWTDLIRHVSPEALGRTVSMIVENR
ncbi:MAG: CBS domain-containing protein [Isosphaeraceae bacterium]